MKRILMLSSHPLFSQGVESLLRREPELEIVGRETDVDKAIERIKELRPDVVIVDSGDPEIDAESLMGYLLQHKLGVNVVGLSLANNTIAVYRKEQIAIAAVEDLIKVIQEVGP